MQTPSVHNLPESSLSTIRPRWEWRVFERRPGSFIGRTCPGPLEERISRETYILSAASPHNVKIRGGVLDVKVLVDAFEELELWRPVLKESFPVAGSALAPVWNAWGLAVPPFVRSSYTLEQFLSELVSPDRRLRTVAVEKRRAQLAGLGCSAERGAIDVAGQHWETLALEDESAERVISVRQGLGPERPAALDYPAFLKGVVGMAAPSTTQGAIV